MIGILFVLAVVAGALTQLGYYGPAVATFCVFLIFLADSSVDGIKNVLNEITQENRRCHSVNSCP